MRIFQPPNTKYSSLREIGKFNMVWNTNAVLMPIFFILFTVLFFLGNPSYKTALFSFCFCLVSYLFLQYFKTYKVIAILELIIGTIVIQALIFVVDETRLVPALMWGILLSIIGNYLFNLKVGTVILLLNMTGVILYLSFGSLETIKVLGMDPVNLNPGLIFDILYVAFAFTYVLHRFGRTISDTNLKYKRQIDKNEVLIKEIHHRVKNNLQIISSLLKLQSSESENELVEMHFKEAIGRIKSIALVHEKIYSTDDFSEIDLPSYLRKLSDDILDSFNQRGKATIDIETNLSKVDLNNFVPFSLILNELITNSIKHGFDGVNNGYIRISLNAIKDQMVVVYEDNGVWKEKSGHHSFGLDLLEILTEQLDGTCVHEHSNGTTYTFTFDLKKFIVEKQED